jgi:hypothetical protein
MAVECGVGIDKTFIGISVIVGRSNASTHVTAWLFVGSDHTAVRC